MIALQAEGVDAVSFCGWQVPIRTDDSLHQGAYHQHRRQRVRDELAKGKVVVVIAGFQGVTTTATSRHWGVAGPIPAVAVAAAMKADRCLIYTDVDAVYTTDPRVVPGRSPLKTVTFEEMLEMAAWFQEFCRFARSNLPASTKSRPGALQFHRSDDPDRTRSQPPARSSVLRKTKTRGTSSHFRHCLQSRRSQGHGAQCTGQTPASPTDPRSGRQANIDVDMIIRTPALAAPPTSRSPFIATSLPKALDVLNRTRSARDSCQGEISVTRRSPKVSVVGIGMRSHVGIAALMFETLSKGHQHPDDLHQRDQDLSMVIDDKYMELAVSGAASRVRARQAAA